MTRWWSVFIVLLFVVVLLFFWQSNLNTTATIRSISRKRASIGNGNRFVQNLQVFFFSAMMALDMGNDRRQSPVDSLEGKGNR
jgi:hypothetical protein